MCIPKGEETFAVSKWQSVLIFLWRHAHASVNLDRRKKTRNKKLFVLLFFLCVSRLLLWWQWHCRSLFRMWTIQREQNNNEILKLALASSSSSRCNTQRFLSLFSSRGWSFHLEESHSHTQGNRDPGRLPDMWVEAPFMGKIDNVLLFDAMLHSM